MSKNKISRITGYRILLAIPTAFALLILFSFTSMQTNHTPSHRLADKQMINSTPSLTSPVNFQDKDTVLRTAVDFTSHYPGGFKAWTQLFNLNFKNPQAAQNNSITGTVYIQFIISKDGKIQSPKVLRGINTDCDQEALRVVSMMPQWKPLLKDGNPISVLYILPISIENAPSSTDTLSSPNNDKPLLVASQNPEFKGGMVSMLNYLRGSIHYPNSARESKVQGVVFVQFVIQSTGKVSNVRILRGIDGECDAEAVRVVKSMPDWNPGRNNGEVVSVMYQIPIMFKP